MQTNKGNTTLIVVLAVLLLLGFWWFGSDRYTTKMNQPLVSNFIECVEGGNTITMNYPRQCISRDGRVYTESALTATAYTSQGGYTTAYSPYSGYSAPSWTSVAYVRYPIASTTSISQPSRYTIPVDSYSSSSRQSYYYTDNYIPAPASYASYVYPSYQSYTYPNHYSNVDVSDCYVEWMPLQELQACLNAAY